MLRATVTLPPAVAVKRHRILAKEVSWSVSENEKYPVPFAGTAWVTVVMYV